jgi:plasmid stability protein
MLELIVREVEPEIVAKLKERAKEHCRSIEEEHRQILREVLLDKREITPTKTFEDYLRSMPDVGLDTDFERIEGKIREVDLSE